MTETSELIHRRKIYPATLRGDLSIGFGTRQAADYEKEGISRTVARRIVRRAAVFVRTIKGGIRHGPKT